MARIEIAPVTQWITPAALQHGATLPQHLMQRLQIGRQQAGALLRQLVALQWLHCEGSARSPLYRPGPLRQVVKTYPLPGLQEDLPWRRDFAPCLDVPSELACMAEHALSELLNNAIDHSGGSSATVSVRQTPLQLQLLVSDDGCGLFDRIAQSFQITEPRLAMLELSKGKLTSAPERHSGRGLFFTSRLADVFDLHANEAAFQCRAWDPRGWNSSRPAARRGTSVYLALALDTPRTLDAVLQAHSCSGQDYGFERTRVSLGLLGAGGEGSGGTMLASRAEAKRALHRLPQFRQVEIDFGGIDRVGHGFADEMFRVFSGAHPAQKLLPVGMGPQVAAMIDSVRAAAAPA